MEVAVIGCGYWGPNLIRNFNSLQECDIYSCCDLDIKNLERMKRLFPQIGVTTNYKDIINSQEIDAVAIATPVSTHYQLAMECILSGKHVLIEKPLAASQEQCMDLIKIAKKMDKILMVGHTFEYTSAVNKIKDILESGELGRNEFTGRSVIHELPEA